MGEEGRAEVDDETQIGLVEAHAQRRCGDQSLDPVLQQIGLRRFPLGVLRPAGVRGHLVSASSQERRHLLGRRDGEGVDDPRARQLLQMVGEPGHAVCGIGQLEHPQAQALPVQWTTQHEGGIVSGARAVAFQRGARAELFGDVGGHPGVGRGGGRQHRNPARQVGQHRAQSAVVRPEIMAPVGDAVGLVHHEQSGRGGELGQHLVAEIGIVQPLGAHQKDVDGALADLRLDCLPLLGVGGVDRARADSGSLGRRHLVAHQGEQR